MTKSVLMRSFEGVSSLNWGNTPAATLSCQWLRGPRTSPISSPRPTLATGLWPSGAESGFEEMVGGRLFVEWGKHARRDAQLPMAPGTADEPDILAQTDARDLARDERRRDPQPRGEEMRLLGIGDERREQLTLWERLRRARRGDRLCA